MKVVAIVIAVSLAISAKPKKYYDHALMNCSNTEQERDQKLGQAIAVMSASSYIITGYETFDSESGGKCFKLYVIP